LHGLEPGARLRRTARVLVWVAVGVALGPAARSWAETWLVPDECATIQAGIDSAAAGDTVLVAPGRYIGAGNRDIDFGGKGIVVLSENGPEATALNTRGTESDPHRGFVFQSGEDSTAVVEGFTIENGRAEEGGGILCQFSSPTLRRNIIRANDAEWGGGICCRDLASPTIWKNTITGNTAQRGGGICLRGASPATIIENTIADNVVIWEGGGIYCEDLSNAVIEANTISTNVAYAGGGVCLRFSSPMVTRNLFIGNHAGLGGGGGICCLASEMPIIGNNLFLRNEGSAGGGVACTWSNAKVLRNTFTENMAQAGGAISSHDSWPDVVNSILWGDTAVAGLEIYVFESRGTVTATYSDVKGGWPGVGNIDADPLFVTGPLGDYYLSQTLAGQPIQSPCVNRGDPYAAQFEGTTRSDGIADWWPMDMGYHHRLNRAPELVDQPDTSVAENEYLTFTLSASDPDGDSILFSSPDLPAGAALNGETGVFEWTPDYEQAGGHTLTFVATDGGIPALADTQETVISVTDVVDVSGGDEIPSPPLSRYLAQTCPNPFSAATTIRYGLGVTAHVRVDVYDIRGALVRRLVNEKLPAGHHRATWDGRDDRGHRAASGIYLCRLETEESQETRRMVLLR
jgi:hypothetical protein